MDRSDEAAELVVDAAKRMEGLLEKAREHAEAGSFLEAMAVLTLVEEGTRTSAEGLARWLGAEEDLACVRPRSWRTSTAWWTRNVR